VGLSDGNVQDNRVLAKVAVKLGQRWFIQVDTGGRQASYRN
jgi:hypothetical protein